VETGICNERSFCTKAANFSFVHQAIITKRALLYHISPHFVRSTIHDFI